MRMRNWFDRIGRYRLGVVLTMPLWVMALVRIFTQEIHVTWRLILFLIGAALLIWAVVSDAWQVYTAKKRMRKMMDEASARSRRNDKV
jgi:hypothetical protein